MSEQTHKYILFAYEKGYRITENGELITPKKVKRKVIPYKRRKGLWSE